MSQRLCCQVMTVDLRHLRSFLAVAGEKNFTRAAARMRVTQPALSRTIGQLEAHLGVRLFDRSTHHVALTGPGEELVTSASAAVAAVDQALDPDALAPGALRLGHAWSALGDLTVPMQRRWRSEHPDVPLRLLRVDDVAASLQRGAIDVGLTRAAELHARFTTATVTYEERVAAIASDHELAGAGRVTLADLRRQTVVFNSSSGGVPGELWGDVPPRRLLAVRNTEDWLSTVASGEAVGVTSVATAHLHPHPGIAYVPVDDVSPMEVSLAWLEPVRHRSIPDLVGLLVDLGSA